MSAFTPIREIEVFRRLSTGARVRAGELAQNRQAVFNLFALNQDDHSKNWAFLQNDDGQWRPAPFHDVTFKPQSPRRTCRRLGPGYRRWNASAHRQEAQPGIQAEQGIADRLTRNTLRSVPAVNCDSRLE